MRKSFLTVAASLTLAGCTGGSTITGSYYNSGYSPAHVTLAAANNPAQAIIRGNPFPNDTDNQGVVAAMQGRNFGPRIYFQSTPRPNDLYGYKVVMSFNGAGPYNYQLCAAPPTGPRPSTNGRIDASAALCVGEILLTDASGYVTGATGPGDPKFKALVADLMLALTPPYDPNRASDDCRGPGC